MPKTKFFLFFLAALFLTGCAGRKTAVTDTPDDAQPRGETPAVFAPAYSMIYVPVEIKANYMEKIINDQLSGTLHRDSASIGGLSVAMAVRRNGRVKVSVRGDELRYTVPLKITMNTAVTIGAFGLSHVERQEGDAGLSLSLRTKISLREDWRLTTSTAAINYAWTNEPTLRVRGVAIPVKPVMDRFMTGQMEPLGRLIDKSLSGSNLVKNIVAPYWQLLQTPLEFRHGSIPHPIWMRVKPADIYMSPIRGQEGGLHATVGIRAAAETFITARPQTAPQIPLPNFKPLTERDSSFVVNLYPEITFADATTMSRETFIGKTFKSGRQRVKVHDIKIDAAENNMAAIAMNLSGSLKGNIRVIGKPVYDRKTQTLTLEHLDFDIETKNNFDKAKNWLLRGIIMSKMKPHLKYPLKDLIDGAQVMADEMLSGYYLGDNMKLNGRADTVEIRGIEMTETGFRVVVLIKGSVGTITIGQF